MSKSNLYRSFVTAIIVFLVLLPLAISDVIAQEKDEWVSKTPMPTRRYNFGLVVVDGRIFAIGGTASDGRTTLGTNEMYNPHTDLWEKRKSIPTLRRAFAIATHQNKVYAIGGINTNANEVYDPTTDTWETKAPLPSQHNRDFLDAQTVNDKIYVISGYTNELDMWSPNSPEVNIYNPSTDTWTNGKQIPHPVCKYASAVINDKIYVFGGIDYTPPINAYNYTQIYDTTTDTWSFGTPMPERRYNCVATAALGEKTQRGIYVLGGVNNDVYSFNMQIYYPEKDSWFYGASFPQFASGLYEEFLLSYPSGAVTIDDIIYAISGTQNLKYVPVGSETPSPSTTPTPTPTIKPAPTLEPESFQTTIAVASIAAIVVIGTGLIVYFKKYRK